MNRIKVLLLTIGLLFNLPMALAKEATIVVAANMKPAMEEVYATYKKTSGQELRIIYGSSGNFMRQIQQGAPFHLFISADEEFPLVLSKEGRTMDDGQVYAVGRLALISHKSRNIKLSLKDSDLKQLIAATNKIALAKPDVAPYGRAAIEFLTNSKVLNIAKAKIVYAENVSAATQYVSTGAAQIGFTAYSLATAQEASASLDYLLIPDHLHQPIRQRMVLLKNAPQSAKDFYVYLQGKQAKEIIRSHGYLTP
jgi:molybdate transport system substrate-binding protein